MRTALLDTAISSPPTTIQRNKNAVTMESHLPSVRQKLNSDSISEKTEQVNLLSEEEEKDPLALDSAIEQHSSRNKLSSTTKHSHSLRRHVPRIIVKPIPPEKKVAVTMTTALCTNAESTTASVATVINTTSGKNTTPSPSSRAGSSRRAQQQAKAAAAATSMAVSTPTTPVTAITQASTMREVLASIPGFSFKPRRRSSKKISTAAQIEQTKDGKIDLETPDSILASTNLRALLNKQTFSMLPPLYQYNLIQLLPSVDREAIEVERKNSESTVTMEAIKLGPSSLNNEFFARACLEWRERLAEGEFTPENQMKMKTEAEREKNKLDPWKLKHFEPIWGEKSYNRASSTSSSSSNMSFSSVKSSDSYTNLMDERLEFKLESKGGLVATIVKTSIKATTATTVAAPATISATAPGTLTMAANTESTDNTTSSSSVDIKEEEMEFVDESIANRNDNIIKSAKKIQSDEMQQQEQTESSTTDYGKRTDGICDMDNMTCTDSSSTFDLLRSECSGLRAETLRQDSKIILTLSAMGHDRQNEFTTSSNVRKRAEYDFSYENQIQTKQMKIEMEMEQEQHQDCHDMTDSTTSIEKSAVHNVVAELKDTPSPSVFSTTSSSQELSGSSSLTNSSVSKAPALEGFMYNSNIYAKFEQSNAELLLKDTISSVSSEECARNTLSDVNMQTSNFLQNQGNPFATVTTVGNSTCNSIATLLSGNSTYVNVKSVLPMSSTRLSGSVTMQTLPPHEKRELKMQLNACSLISLEDGEDVNDEELIEQKFADAHNYVLESGEVSTDSSADANSALLTPVDSGNIKEKKFLFCDSVDQGATSHACDNLYENKQEITSCISSVAISSASSSSSSMTSAPTTSADMLYSTAAQLSAATRISSEQKQQQQQQQMMLSMTEKDEESFHRVQHDWNFGGIKLQQQSEATPNNFNGVIQTHQGVIKMKNVNNLSIEGVAMPSVNAIETDGVEECIEEGDDVVCHNAAIVNCRGGVGVSVGVVDVDDSGDMGTEADEDDDDAEDEDDDDDADDNDAVRDIVDELQQQHQRLLKEQQHQMQMEDPHELQESEDQEHRGHIAYEHSDYELASDMLCDVQMATNEMEVSSTVITNSNSDDSVNELNMGCNNHRLDGSGGSNLTIQLNTPSPATLGHLHQQQSQQQTAAERHSPQQRQILVDSNGQIIGNFLVQHQQQAQQQQQLEHQQNLLHHATQQFTFQAAQQQTSPLTLSTQQHLQPQQQHAQKSQNALSTIRKAIEMSSNGQHYLPPGSITTQQHIGQQLVLQQQPQQRHFLTQQQVPTVAATSNCNVVTSSPSQQQQNQIQQVQQQLQRFQQQHHIPAFQALATQSQSQPNTQKYISKQMNLITMPRGSAAASVGGSTANISSVTIPPATAVNPYPPYNSAIVSSARSSELLANAAGNVSAVNTSNASVVSSMKGLTQAGIPTTIAQQRLTSKLASGKGRKTVNKLPPGAVNLERSYQICQAVIQNSPNRENLKAQLRPPSAILNQQQQHQQQLQPGSMTTTQTLQQSGATTASPSVPISIATSTPSAATTSPSPSFIKQDEVPGIPTNIMGVGRPGVYKVIGPRMGFPRKKYVQRKPSPTLIRHLFTPQTPSVLHPNVATNPRLQQQLTAAAAQHQHPHQHDLHQNGNGGGQYVLVHRANVGAADNQAPRASSAPPIPQTTQSQLHNMNGIPITGRGRPASVDIDASNTMLDNNAQYPQLTSAVNTNASAGMVRRNFAAGNITYIDNLIGAAAMTDGNYIVTTTATAPLDAEQLANKAAAAGGGGPGNGSIITRTEAENCACSLNAMVICQQCGAFCHDDCLSASKVCVSCVIR